MSLPLLRHFRNEHVRIIRLVAELTTTTEFRLLVDALSRENPERHFFYEHSEPRFLSSEIPYSNQGLKKHCIHAKLSNKGYALNPLLPTRNPLLTSFEDALLYHTAMVIEARSPTLANALRKIREVNMCVDSGVRQLFDCGFLDSIDAFDKHGICYLMNWSVRL